MLRGLTKTLEGIKKEIKTWKREKRMHGDNATVGGVHMLRTRIHLAEKVGLRPVDDLVKDTFKDLGYPDPTKVPFGLYLCVQEQLERAWIRGTCAMEKEMQEQIDA